MANGTRVRDWATVDYYALLGVAPNADADAVTRAYPRAGQALAPRRDDDDARRAERFSDITAAYAVLGDPANARGVRPGAGRARRPGVAATAPCRCSRSAAPEEGPQAVVAAPGDHGARRRRARARCSASGRRSSRGRCTSTTRTSAPGSCRSPRTRVDGTVVDGQLRDAQRARACIVPEPQQHGDPNGAGTTVKIRYDPAEPRST